MPSPINRLIAAPRLSRRRRPLVIAATLAAVLFAMALPAAHAQFTFASDNAGNYGGGWANGSNGGTGWNAWVMSTQAGATNFIGNPSAAGISTTGIGTSAFGMRGTQSGNYANITRSLSTGLGVGDSLTFYWGVNWDTDGGGNNKGFNLRAGNTELFNVNMGGSTTVTVNGVNTGFLYGTTPMLVTVTRTGSGYSFSMTSKSGGATFTTNVTSSSTIDTFAGYAANNNGDVNRNIYFNNFTNANSGVFNQGGTVGNANRFTGGGNLSVGNNTTLALTGSGNNDYTGTTTIDSGSTLRFQGAGTSDFASAISGGGALVMSNSSGVLNLAGANSGFTGAITVSAGILEARNANSLGTTAGNTTVSSGGTLKIFSGGAGFSLADALTIAGTGIGTGIGAINNTGGDNSLTGTITLAGNARINADTTGTSGSLTIGGNITGGNNVLFLGAAGGSGGNTGGNITINGAISGAGNTQNDTITSIYKDGAGTLTLGGNNSYSGDTRIVAGTLAVNSGGTLGNGDSDVFISGGAQLQVNTSVIVDSVRETGTTNGGTINLGTGATLTIDGANKGLFFQNSISGGGNLTLSGSGTTVLGLYGTQSYTGATTVSGGKLSTGVALATSGVNVSGGTFETTAASILSSNATVAISGTGTYALGGSDTVGSFSITGGSLTTTNNATLIASTYTLQGGTVGANLGAGNAVASTGTTALNGTLGGNLNVNGGTINLGSAGRLANTAAVSLSGAGQLNLGGNESIGALSGTGGGINVGAHRLTTTIASGTSTFGGAISGTTGGLTKAGSGRLVLSNTHSYSGITEITAGDLNLAGAVLTNSAVTVASGASLSGYGSIGTLGGAGTVNPGNSPGIITTTQVNPSAGTDFNFEFTGTVPLFSNPGASVNDLIRITGATPFSQSLGGSNIINVYFSGAALYTGGNTPKVVTGGFYTDRQLDFTSEIQGATFNYFFAYEGVTGPTVYNGINYGTLEQYQGVLGYDLTITISTIGASADFDGSTINGQILQYEVIPEPSTYALLTLAAAAFAAHRWRRRRP